MGGGIIFDIRRIEAEVEDILKIKPHFPVTHYITVYLTSIPVYTFVQMLSVRSFVLLYFLVY